MDRFRNSVCSFLFYVGNSASVVLSPSVAYDDLISFTTWNADETSQTLVA